MVCLHGLLLEVAFIDWLSDLTAACLCLNIRVRRDRQWQPLGGLPQYHDQHRGQCIILVKTGVALAKTVTPHY